MKASEKIIREIGIETGDITKKLPVSLTQKNIIMRLCSLKRVGKK